MSGKLLLPRISNVIRSLIVTPFLLLGACDKAQVAANQATVASTSQVQRANPASEHCMARGGRHSVERTPGGGEFGVCLFEDDRQCEEWALLRGECPAGGLRVTGYATPSARFCAISGGKYVLVSRSGAAEEKGDCTLPGGKKCDAEEYFRGVCTREKPDAQAAFDSMVRFG